MHRINLLYVITKLELGGAQKQLLSLISRLDKEKFRIFLFTAKEGLLFPAAESIKGLTIIKSKFLERPINLFKDFLVLIEIYRFIKENKIGIVHTHSSKAGIIGRYAAKLAKVRIVFHTVHGWSFNDYQPWLERAGFVWLERLASGFTNKLVVVSNHDKQKGIEKGIGREEKYALIRYGVEDADFKFSRENAIKELGIENDNLIVAMIACFKPQKCPQDFIKLAFLTKQEFPNAKFILIGDGILRQKIEKLISKLNLQEDVILTGWRQDVPAILSAVDVFVLTSLWEGLPIAVLEAMMSAKPVISTSTGGVKEVIIEGQTGFLVLPHDLKSMSEKLIQLLKDNDLRRNIGQRAKGSLGNEYFAENMVRKTEDLYKALCQ